MKVLPKIQRKSKFALIWLQNQKQRRTIWTKFWSLQVNKTDSLSFSNSGKIVQSFFLRCILNLISWFSRGSKSRIWISGCHNWILLDQNLCCLPLETSLDNPWSGSLLPRSLSACCATDCWLRTTLLCKCKIVFWIPFFLCYLPLLILRILFQNSSHSFTFRRSSVTNVTWAFMPIYI